MRRLLPLVLTLAASPVFPFYLIAPRTGPSPYSQTARVASDGIDYLVAWTMSGTPIGTAIYTTVARADGSPTDLGRWVQATQPGASDTPQVNPHGVSITPGRDGYFLSWVSDEGLSTAIADSFGRVEHVKTLPMDKTDNSVSTLGAWNGAAHLVVTTSNAFSAWLYDNNGDPLVMNLPVGHNDGDNFLLALTADSGGFLVLSTKTAGPKQHDLYGRRISSTGVPGEWFFICSNTPAIDGLAVTSDGSHDLIAWSTAFGLWTMQIDPQTNAAANARQILSDALHVRNILVTGGRTWITYVSDNTYAITLAGETSQTAPLLIERNAARGDSDLTSNGTGVLSVASQFTASEPSCDIRARFLTPASAGAPFEVTTTVTDQEHGALAAGPNQGLAVWDEKLTTGRQIFAARFDPLKGLLDPAGFQISESGNNVQPVAAFNGTNYLVVWMRQVESVVYQVVGRRVSPDGRVLDSADVLIGEAPTYFELGVTSDGTNWLVVSTRGFSEVMSCGGFMGSFHLFATRISPSGAVLDGAGGVPIADSDAAGNRNVEVEGFDQSHADVAWTGSAYVIAWTRSCSNSRRVYPSSIAAATASPDLSEVRTARVSLEGYTWNGADSSHSHPRVAGSGGRTLIAWEHSTGTETATELATFDHLLPALSDRQRVFGNRRSFPSLAGQLDGAGSDANGQNYVLTQMTVPGIAPAHQGIWQTAINSDGSSKPPVFLRLLDYGEALTGNVIVSGGTHWTTSALFDPGVGAVRVKIAPF